MANPSNYYRLLGVSASATDDEIRAAYRRVARQWHPDLNKDPAAAEMMGRINRARDTLLNSAARTRYDREQASRGPQTAGASTRHRSGPRGTDWAAHEQEARVREDEARSRGGASAGRERHTGKRRTRDVGRAGAESVGKARVPNWRLRPRRAVFWAASWLVVAAIALAAYAWPTGSLQPTEAVAPTSTATPSPTSIAAVTVSPLPTSSPVSTSTPMSTVTVQPSVVPEQPVPEDPPGRIALTGLQVRWACYPNGAQVDYRYTLSNQTGRDLKYAIGVGDAGLPPVIGVQRRLLQRLGPDNTIAAIYPQRPFARQLDDGRYSFAEEQVSAKSFLATHSWPALVEYELNGQLGLDTTHFPAGDYRLYLEWKDLHTGEVLDVAETDFRIGSCAA